MADPKPFLPISNSDGTNPCRSSPCQRSKKKLFSVLAGVFLVFLLVAMLGDSKVCTDKHSNIDMNALRSTTKGTLNAKHVGPVSRGVSEGVSEKASLISSHGDGDHERLGYAWNNSMLSWQRTAFHFQPEKNWMNDPNGPLFYKGWYHFFYQYNPNAAVWGVIVWGHAVSKDLIHWLHLPLAMVADQWYDINGVWTGSATILPNGKVVMLYTGLINESFQVQNLAYPADNNDPLLINWIKYPGNPVLVPPPGIGSKDFRDPTTAWLTSEGKWRIAIGSKVNRTGFALVYETEDFINYKLLSQVLHGVPGTGMWECVDFFPVSKTGENGLDTSVNGPDVKHVVKASLVDDWHDYYAIGTYDEKTGTWIPDHPEIDVGIGIRYDYGIYYAAKTFYDQNKGRRILWGWIGESDSEVADVKKGWASLQGIPRTIVLDTKSGYKLIQWPVEEVESLRLGSTEFNNVQVEAGSVVPLELESATQLDIVAEFKLDKLTLASTPESNEEFICSKSRGAIQRGALGPFGLLVLADSDRSEQTPVYFYLVKGSNGTFKSYVCTDQSRSSIANDVNKQIYGSYVPVLEGEKLSLRILVDHSIIETFAQGGRSTITSRVYPTRAIYGAAKLFLFNNATNVSVTSSVTIWQMNSAFIRPHPDVC